LQENCNNAMCEAAQREDGSSRAGPNHTPLRERGNCMATDDNNAGDGGGNGDNSSQAYEALGLLYEARIGVETVAHGLEAIHDKSADPMLREQMNVLRKLTSQLADGLEALQVLVMKAFKLDGTVGHA
jgi:hypothetical protein